LGGSLAATGLLIAMLLPGTATAIAGFAFVGLGLAALVPAVFSAAGQTPGVPASVSIATVSTIGYFGFLCGPPLIGVASQAVTLRWAIGLVFLAACVAVALSRNMAVEKRNDVRRRPLIGLALPGADFAEMGVSKR
jgi:MFS family permease